MPSKCTDRNLSGHQNLKIDRYQSFEIAKISKTTTEPF
jgi:hypothetical protein